MNTTKADYCTCADRACPLHPANHGKGCTPCMMKNLRAGEVPSCLWNLVSTREERQREGCDYRIASFAEMVRRKAPPPSPSP
ncbi:MAG: hypothetical protein IKO01_06770 [Kiritimatiellae bacterium]|nr:hypothetical protein [Kiritimatiellia bacterium]MBR4251215.1 hypothetical protein [Kiritimatiellia bacterium]